MDLVGDDGCPRVDEIDHVRSVEVGESEVPDLAILLQVHEVIHRLVVVLILVIPPSRNND